MKLYSLTETRTRRVMAPYRTAHAPNPLLNPVAQAIEVDVTGIMIEKRIEIEITNHPLTNTARPTVPIAKEAGNEVESVIEVENTAIAADTMMSPLNPPARRIETEKEKKRKNPRRLHTREHLKKFQSLFPVVLAL